MITATNVRREREEMTDRHVCALLRVESEHTYMNTERERGETIKRQKYTM